MKLYKKPNPNQLTSAEQLIQPSRGVRTEAAGEDVLLPELDWKCESLQRHQDLSKAVDSSTGGGVTVDPLPGSSEAGEGVLLCRFDLFTQCCKRGTAQAAQHFGITPLTLNSARAELATNESPSIWRLFRTVERSVWYRSYSARVSNGPCVRASGGPNASPHPRRLQGTLRGGCSAACPGCIAVEAGILGVDPTQLPADSQLRCSPFTLELG